MVLGKKPTRIKPGHWFGVVSDQYMVGKVPSGGYLTKLALDCVVGELNHASKEPPLPNQKRAPNPHPDVLTTNVHFMNSTLPGHFTCTVDILKSGKTTSSIQASVYQNDKETMRLLCTCGDLNAAESKGPNIKPTISGDHSKPPLLPPYKDCIRVDAGDNMSNSVRSRVILMVPPNTANQYDSCRATNKDGSFDEEILLKRNSIVTTNNSADYSGYTHMSDGSEPTLLASSIYLDASIPPILGAYVTGWVPTINWTVQHFKHPKPGLLRFRFKTSRVVGGFLEEDGELWDVDNNLVAVSRQLALVGVSQKSKSSKL